MIVRYWMTPAPTVALEDMTLYDALRMMRRHRIRRLPVLRGSRLCGIISLSDLYTYIDPAHIGSVVLPEAGCRQLEQKRVGDVMSAGPVTCTPNSPLEEAGKLMRDRKVGALPVVQGEELVGIITESDVLTALASIACADEKGKRICLRVPHGLRQEIFNSVVALCQEYRLELLVLLTHPLRGESAHLVMVRVRGPRVQEFLDAISDSRFRTLLVQ